MQRWIVGLCAWFVGSAALSQTTEGITPGRSFGRVKIGMSKVDVTKLLGKPESEGLLEGDITESIWLGSIRKEPGLRLREFVAVYFYRNTVIQIDGTSPKFTTKSGLSTKSAWSEFAAKVTTTTQRKRAYPLDEDQPRMLHFASDNSEIGFGWVQVRYEEPGIKVDPDAPVDMIVVHRPGTRMIFGLANMTLWTEPPHGATTASANPKVVAEKTTSPKTASSGKKPMAKRSPKGAKAGTPKPTEPAVERRSVVLKAGDPSPMLSGSTAAGDKFDLKAALKKAKGAVVHFWYLGNEPSEKQLAKFQDLADVGAPQGLVVVAVNLGDKVESVRAHLYEKKIRIPVLIDQNGEGAVADFGILSFPTSVVTDSEGKVVDVIYGVNDERLKKALEKIGVSNP